MKKNLVRCPPFAVCARRLVSVSLGTPGILRDNLELVSFILRRLAPDPFKLIGHGYFLR